MESHWIKTILAVFGVLFAIGGAVSAFLQAKWLRDQRKTLGGILDVLRAMREDDFKKGIGNPDREGVLSAESCAPKATPAI